MVHPLTRPGISSARFLPPLLALAIGSSLAQADVVRMGALDTSYTTIQDAVDASVDGDTLLVGEDIYERFVIDGKGLTIIAMPGTGSVVYGKVTVRNLPSGSSVLFDRVSFQGRNLDDEFSLFHEDALLLEQNAGIVQFYNCSILGGSGSNNNQGLKYDPPYPAGGTAARVVNCSSLAFSNCLVQGGDGSGLIGWEDGGGGDGGHGLWSTDSAIAIYNSSIVGGTGGTLGTYGGDGGHGGYITGISGLFSSGSLFRGGNGGDADDYIFPAGGDGGTGLYVTLGSSANLVDNTYLGGAFGTALNNNGQAGLPKFWEGGPLDELPGKARSLEVLESFLGDGESFQLRVEGEPGDRVYLAIGVRPRFRFVANLPGVEMVAAPQHIDWNSVMTIGTSGVLNIPLNSFERPAGGWKSMIAQVRVLPAGGGNAIGGSVLLSSVDDEGGPDCNGNGRMDIYDILLGDESDCNGDLLPDTCTMTGDCNNNGIDDLLDMECGPFLDLNQNQIPDVCEPHETVYVDAGAPAGGDGTQASPFRDLQQAVANTLDGWSVEIASGVYSGPQNRNIVPSYRSLNIYSPAGPAACVIDLQQSGYAFKLDGDTTTHFTGITIENGMPSQSIPASGGVWSQQPVTVILSNCVFRNNQTHDSGGAINLRGNLSADNCSFENNHADSTGGAIISTGTSRLSQCVFEGNSAFYGGAVYINWSEGPVQVTLTHSTFRNNSAGSAGGALSIRSGDGHLDNCLFESNSTGAIGDGHGGAIWHNADSISKLLITSSTFVSNDAGSSTDIYTGGGAIYAGRDSKITLLNSVLWGNTASNGPDITIYGTWIYPAQVNIGHCDLQFGIAGIPVTDGTLNHSDVLSLDPQFLAPGMGNFQLAAGSPCVDAGKDAFLAGDTLDIDSDGDTLEVVPLDLAGNSREVDDPATTDTGVGSVPLTDMGAFERP